jgi:hypothetical protein
MSTTDTKSQRIVASMAANLRRVFPDGKPKSCSACRPGSAGCVMHTEESCEFLYRMGMCVMCPLDETEGEVVHKLVCIEGACEKWDVKMGTCPHLESVKPVIWHTYEKDDHRRMVEAHKDGTLTEYMAVLREIEDWIPFDFTERWESNAFKRHVNAR